MQTVSFAQLAKVVQEAVSRNDVALLAKIFYQTLFLGKQGQEVRAFMEANTDKMAHALGHGKVDTFRQLVEHYDWSHLVQLYAQSFAHLVDFLQAEGGLLQQSFCTTI